MQNIRWVILDRKAQKAKFPTIHMYRNRYLVANRILPLLASVIRLFGTFIFCSFSAGNRINRNGVDYEIHCHACPSDRCVDGKKRKHKREKKETEGISMEIATKLFWVFVLVAVVDGPFLIKMLDEK